MSSTILAASLFNSQPFPPTTAPSENDSTTRKVYPFPALTISTNMSTLTTTAAPQDSLLTATQPLSSLISPAPFVLQPHLSSHPLVRQVLTSMNLQHQRERRDSFTSPQQSPSLPQGSWQSSPHLHPATSPTSVPVTPLVLGDPHPLAASFRMERELELALRAQSPLATRDSFVPEQEEGELNE